MKMMLIMKQCQVCNFLNVSTYQLYNPLATNRLTTEAHFFKKNFNILFEFIV